MTEGRKKNGYREKKKNEKERDRNRDKGAGVGGRAKDEEYNDRKVRGN